MFGCRGNNRLEKQKTRRGISDWDICPTINQAGRRRAKRHSTGKPIGDPRAPISSGALQALTVRAAGPSLLRPSITPPIAGISSFFLFFAFSRVSDF